MKHERRIARTQDDIERELIDQLQLLRHDCQQFDSGFEPAAKRIALSLRVLLHHHRQSNALLHQLNLRSGQFLDTAGPLKPNNCATDFKLLAIVMCKQSVRFLPLIAAHGTQGRNSMVPFNTWWSVPVIKDSKGNRFARFDLVMHVAETDGGAHVDPDLSEAYMALSRQNSLAAIYRRGSLHIPLEGRPELACMRQIAHEVLATLSLGSSRFAAEAVPVIPEPFRLSLATVSHFEFG